MAKGREDVAEGEGGSESPGATRADAARKGPGASARGAGPRREIAIPPPPDSLSSGFGPPSLSPTPGPRQGGAPREASALRLPPRLPPHPPQPEKHRTFWEKVLRVLASPRKLKVTREGKYYLGITLGVGFAAINTGNNLLYLLLGMLLSLMLVSGVMSDLSLRRLTVTRRLPVRAQVGRAHLVEIEVYNHKKRVPSYAIEVEDLRAGQPADKRCFFLKISPSSAQVAAYRRTPARRGRDRHTGFRIATRFPFGLFEKSREVDAEGELIIYPAVDAVRLTAEEAGRREGGVGANGRGSGDETYALRPMRQGDDPRDIYWRKSTVRDQLILRERSRETRPDIEAIIDPVRPTAASGTGPQAEAFNQQFEKRIREVASRAVAHIKRGDGVVVSTTLGERVRGDKNLGSDPILRFLALLEAVDEAKAPALRAERAARALIAGRSAPMEAAPKLNPAGAEGRAAKAAGSSEEDRRKGGPNGSGPRPIAGGRA
jgi:uncharacterized protein (DUF58 family)